MSKTGSEVKTNVYAITKFTDDKFEEQLSASDAFIIAINEALHMLADKGLLFASQEVAAIASHTHYDLPDDCTVILSVLDSRGRFYPNWQSNGNQIAFGDADVYTINYQPYPAEITALTDTLPYRDMYFTAICDYVKYWMYLFDDEESKVAPSWYQRFENDAQKVYELLNKNHGPAQMQVQRGGMIYGGPLAVSGSGSTLLTEVKTQAAAAATSATSAASSASSAAASLATLESTLEDAVSNAITTATESAATSATDAASSASLASESATLAATSEANAASSATAAAASAVQAEAIAGSLTVGALTYYVDASVSASGDGLTESTAFKTIQEAIDLINNRIIIGDVTIWVASGTYAENLTVKNVTIQGMLNFQSGINASASTVTVAPSSGKVFYFYNVIANGISLSYYNWVLTTTTAASGFYGIYVEKCICPYFNISAYVTIKNAATGYGGYGIYAVGGSCYILNYCTTMTYVSYAIYVLRGVRIYTTMITITGDASYILFATVGASIATYYSLSSFSATSYTAIYSIVSGSSILSSVDDTLYI